MLRMNQAIPSRMPCAADAIQSGRFTYTQERVGGRSEEHTLILKGKSWKRRFVDRAEDMPWSIQPDVLKHHSPETIRKPKGLVESIAVSHKGRTVEYQRLHNRMGRCRTSAVALRESLPHSLFPSFPRHLGSFYHASTKEFVAKNLHTSFHHSSQGE